MKKLIRKWLNIPTIDEIVDCIHDEVKSRVDKRYNKLRKADKDRFKELKKLMEKENE